MIPKEVLLREKERYELPLHITKRELKQLKKSYPVQKIIGFQEMQNIYIDLNYKVLIPRYETEEVILECYKYINNNSKVLDLGCGSGFIGLAIKKNIDCFVTLVDKSLQAIKQTKKNAQINKLNVDIIKSDWFKKVSGKFDLIVSNPPYLNKKLISNKSLRYEPKLALFAKDSGFFSYKQILKNVKKYLKKDGILIFEIDPFISKKLQKIYPKVVIKKDINGKDRIAILKFNQI
ncbi:peptide chain release factor N(5)-glutamine methyltransferase [Metamycoplasma buccale]|uniref:peptide chain release factor N(5)-glutamine methyltransferase n=1 Tax=Metamycoplasma buccale TaxID=55602 RepID=UPI00398E662E